MLRNADHNPLVESVKPPTRVRALFYVHESSPGCHSDYLCARCATLARPCGSGCALHWRRKAMSASGASNGCLGLIGILSGDMALMQVNSRPSLQEPISCMPRPAAYNRPVRLRAAILVVSALWAIIAPVTTFAAASIVRTPRTAESVSAPTNSSAESWASRGADARESVAPPEKDPRSAALARAAVRRQWRRPTLQRSGARPTRARAYPPRRALRPPTARSDTSAAPPV